MPWSAYSRSTKGLTYSTKGQTFRHSGRRFRARCCDPLSRAAQRLDDPVWRAESGGLDLPNLRLATTSCLSDGFEQAFEKLPNIRTAMFGTDHAFGVGHHAEHIAGLVDDTGDIAGRTVDGFGIAEGDA